MSKCLFKLQIVEYYVIIKLSGPKVDNNNKNK